VEESKDSGIWHFARNYVLSFAAVLTLGFLLLVSLLVSAGLAAAGKYAAAYIPEGVLHIASMIVSFVVVMALFAMMFKWLPTFPSAGGTSGWAHLSPHYSLNSVKRRSASTLVSRDWNRPTGPPLPSSSC
jgi:hypothetical protein